MTVPDSPESSISEKSPENQGSSNAPLAEVTTVSVLVLFAITVALVGPTPVVVGGFVTVLALCLGRVDAVRSWFRGA